ncbi:MAG: plasmid stabilization protein [Sphingomonadaceae bacterium]|jgi:mRNA-degrading endonuclease YafQ of YafQ-DinJ toxin-antitoxin module|nr:plasmid stabilization protein [Sphingomonadaceae bacterium]
MAWLIISTAQYERRAVKFFKRNPQLLSQYEKTLQLLEANPHHPSLRLHALRGKLVGLHSISINMSHRITLELLVTDGEIHLINIGTHGEVYR